MPSKACACGAVNDASLKVCAFCGADLGPPLVPIPVNKSTTALKRESPRNSPRQTPTGFRRWSVLFVLLLVLVGLIVARRNAVEKEQKAREQAAAQEQERQKVALEQNAARLEAERTAASREAYIRSLKKEVPHAQIRLLTSRGSSVGPGSVFVLRTPYPTASEIKQAMGEPTLDLDFSRASAHYSCGPKLEKMCWSRQLYAYFGGDGRLCYMEVGDQYGGTEAVGRVSSEWASQVGGKGLGPPNETPAEARNRAFDEARKDLDKSFKAAQGGEKP